jgi:hypothetical protein
MRFIKTYKLFEGGNALHLARPIKQSEVRPTLETIKDVIFPALGLIGFGEDVIQIGSAGKKVDDDDTSGDIDMGIAVDLYAAKNNISPDEVLDHIYATLQKEFPAFESRIMKGLEVVSLGYPIANKPELGYVQLDFIPVRDMTWAKFIYYAPNRRKGESKYKSAHRNWLFCAILSQIIEDEEFDLDGNKLGYRGYMMKLTDGLSKIKKSFIGKTKLLKNPVKTEDVAITKNPNEFVKFLYGPGVRPNQVKTFEMAYEKMLEPDFKYADRLPAIEKEFKKFLHRVKLDIPKELRKNNKLKQI